MMRWDGDGDSSGSSANGRSGRNLRLLLVWPQPLVRAALVALFERLGHRVVGTFGNWPALIAAAADAADMAIVDVDAMSTTTLEARGLALPIVVIAPSANYPGLVGVIERGAAGLVLGSESTESLKLCLAAVAGGGRWFDQAALAEIAERSEALNDALLLTRRERDVARLVATGQRNRAIADSLGISEGTVKMHLHNVYAKLGLQSRTQLAMDERLRMRG